jgi:hypothetical protein
MATALNIVMAGLLGLGVVAPLAAQEAGDATFPASAVIRGENIWLRVEPAAVSEVVAILQRGEAVTLTTDALAGDGEMYYPVTVDATGESGWVRELFINPRSIVPLDVPPATDVSEAEAPDAVADEDAAANERRERRNRNRDGAGEPVPVEETAAAPAAATSRISGVGTSVSDMFMLEPGRYRATVVMDVQEFSGFIAVLHGPDGFEEYIFNEVIETPQTWTAETVVETDIGGEYFVEVTNTVAAWTMTFDPQ